MTEHLIHAFNQQDLAGMAGAIANGADVNCRVIFDNENKAYRLASETEIANVWQDEEAKYTVPSCDTTTLLNILSIQKDGDSDANLAIAKLLLDNHANLGAIDNASYWRGWGKAPANYFQNTPLLNAIASYNVRFAELCMTYLSHYEPNQRKEILDHKDKFSAGYHSALEFAIRRGYSGLATEIVKQGADPNPEPFVYAYDGKSPLHMACMSLGQSWTGREWHRKLGSDIELIETLIQHGANFTNTVPTTILMTTAPTQFLRSTENKRIINLAPLDYINLKEDNSTSTGDFDLTHACDAPAYSPIKIGQVMHGFHEDQSFRDPIAEELLKRHHSRQNYLSSHQFKTQDKFKIIQALLSQIICEHVREHSSDDFLLGFPIEEINSLEIYESYASQFRQELLSFSALEEKLLDTGAFIGSLRVNKSCAKPISHATSKIFRAVEPKPEKKPDETVDDIRNLGSFSK